MITFPYSPKPLGSPHSTVERFLGWHKLFSLVTLFNIWRRNKPRGHTINLTDRLDCKLKQNSSMDEPSGISLQTWEQPPLFCSQPPSRHPTPSSLPSGQSVCPSQNLLSSTHTEELKHCRWVGLHVKVTTAVEKRTCRIMKLLLGSIKIRSITKV